MPGLCTKWMCPYKGTICTCVYSVITFPEKDRSLRIYRMSAVTGDAVLESITETSGQHLWIAYTEDASGLWDPLNSIIKTHAFMWNDMFTGKSNTDGGLRNDWSWNHSHNVSCLIWGWRWRDRSKDVCVWLCLVGLGWDGMADSVDRGSLNEDEGIDTNPLLAHLFPHTRSAQSILFTSHFNSLQHMRRPFRWTCLRGFGEIQQKDRGSNQQAAVYL